MITVGLTGNMGSGKSTVARIFLSLGIPVFNADNEARRITQSNEIAAQIAVLFGRKLLNSSGELDRKALAAIVFNDKQKLKQLNELIHPLVWENYISWLKENKSADYIIHEAAILFESGLYKHLDKIIVVDAPREVLIQRTIQRDHISEEQVQERLNNQWSTEKIKELADFVIINDNINALLPQVIEIDKKLKTLF